MNEIDKAFAAHKAAEQAEEVGPEIPTNNTGRFELYVPGLFDVDKRYPIEEILRQLEGVDEIFKNQVHRIGGSEPTEPEILYTIYSFDVPDAFALGPQVREVVYQILRLLDLDDLYVVWHAVTGVRWTSG